MAKPPFREEPDEEFRLDKWLWAARFFKTRGLAAAAIDGGRVDVNEDRAKRGRRLAVGDQLRIRQGPYEHIVIIKALSHRRGPAAQAAQLYEETVDSRRSREIMAGQIKAANTMFTHSRGRPGKKERRELRRFKDREG